MPEACPVRRILVVDDDDGIGESLTDALTTDDHEVVGARDGREALGLLEQRPYDLVLSTCRMSTAPRCTRPCGRAFPVRFATPLPRVIVLTGNAAEHVEFLRGTTDPILEKPFPSG